MELPKMSKIVSQHSDARDNHIQLQKEAQAFNAQAAERVKNGFVPDLRALSKVSWFNNNVWREPELVELHWMPRINAIITRAKQKKGRVLEVGCGLGMLSLELARNGLDVIGVDVSPESIKIANQYREKNTYTSNFGSLEYKCIDALSLDIPEQSLDTIVFFRSLHHIAELDKIMKKAKSWLKPNGCLILSEPVRDHFNKNSAFIAGLLRMILPTWKSYTEKCSGDWNINRWEKYLNEIFAEYTYDEDHQQSPMDNSVSDADEIHHIIKKYFTIKEQYRCDAFIDKIIGGLRGDDRFALAKFLLFLDEYMIKNGMLEGTSLELFAERI